MLGGPVDDELFRRASTNGCLAFGMVFTNVSILPEATVMVVVVTRALVLVRLGPAFFWWLKQDVIA